VLFAQRAPHHQPRPRAWNQDHLSTTVLARALFGRVYAEAAVRATWFFVDADRPDPKRKQTLYLSLFHTLWPSERQHLEVGSWPPITSTGARPS